MQGPKSTIAVKPGDCFERWHQVTCREFSLTECRRFADDEFRASISIRNFGTLMVNDIWSSTRAQDPIRVTRSLSDIRQDSRDYFMLWFVIGGETVFAQNEREAHLRRGDLVLHDQARPFSLEFSKRSRSIMISIPRPLLTARLPDAPQLTARRIPRQSKLAALASSVMRQLTRLDDQTAEDTVRRVGASALDIFAAAIEAELTGESGPKHGRERIVQVKKYILANLQDPELDLDTIAAAHNMAPRTLNRLFAQESTTPIRWLWQQRLAASYKALAEGHTHQVTEAALSFGFSDLSHFSRAFKSAFGQSPHSLSKHRRQGA